MDDKLLDNRIIFIKGEIDKDSSNEVVSKLLYLDSINNDDICLYINSPGGSVNDGLAIIDTMRIIKSDVKTFCVGSSFSMAAVILCCGSKNKRFCLKNSEVMIHSPSGFAYGKSDDIDVSSKRLNKCKEQLIEIISKNSRKTKKEINKYFIKDYFMNSKEALDFGLIDKIL